MASNNNSLSFSKWQLAVALGTTGLIGIGYWYLRNSVNKPKSENKKKTDFKSNSISLDLGDETTQSTEETPLQRAQRFKNEGNKLFKSGKFDEAITYYNRAIEECPKDKKVDLAMFFQNRAAAYEQLKKWSSVKDDCTKALELNPTYLKALLRRAKAAEITKDFDVALEDITAVCIMEKFQNQSSLLLADRILKELGKKHAKEAMLQRKPIMPSRHFIKIYFSSFSQDPIKTMLDNIRVDESDLELKGFKKALLALKNQNYDGIISACNEEIESSESEAQHKTEALMLRATFNLLTGRHNDALVDFETIINNSDIDIKMRVNALIKQAELNMKLDKPDLSMDNFQKALDLDPLNSDIYHHRAQYFLLLGNEENASKDFEKAVELNSDFAITHAQKCYANYRQASSNMNVEQMTSVVEDFQKTIERFPKCCECYSLYAQVLTDQQKYKEAEQYFLKTMEFDPDNATVYVQRAILQLHWKSDIDKSIELINMALNIDNKCEYAYEALGSIEVQRGNLKHAIELFEKAIELAKTENEMTHLFSLKDAAVAQLNVLEKIGGQLFLT